MKNWTQKAGKIVFVLTMALLCFSCDEEDNLEEIFTDSAWTLSFIQEGAEKSTPDKDYVITFQNNTFVLTTYDGTTITGNWQADADSRAFTCNNIKASSDISNDKIALTMYNILEKAISYSGDSNWLQIVQQPNNVFMQFYNR